MAAFVQQNWRNDAFGPQHHLSNPHVPVHNSPAYIHNPPVQDFSRPTPPWIIEDRFPNVQELVGWLRLCDQNGPHPAPKLATVTTAFDELDQAARVQAAQMQAARLQAEMQAALSQAAQPQDPAPAQLDVNAIVLQLQASIQHARNVLERHGPVDVSPLLDELDKGVSQRLPQPQAPAHMDGVTTSQDSQSFDSPNHVSPPVTNNNPVPLPVMNPDLDSPPVRNDMDLYVVQQHAYPSLDVNTNQFHAQGQQAHATYDAPHTCTAQEQPTTPNRKQSKDTSNKKRQHATAGKSRITKSKAKTSKVNHGIAQEAVQQDMDPNCFDTSARDRLTRSPLQSKFSRPHVDKPMPMPQTTAAQTLTEQRPSMQRDEPQFTAEFSSPNSYLSRSEPQVTAAPSYSQPTAAQPLTYPHIDKSQSEPQVTAAPSSFQTTSPRRNSSINAHGRTILRPCSPKRRHSSPKRTPVLSSWIPGWLHQTPSTRLRKRSFDEYSDDEEFQGMDTTPSPATGRGNFFRSIFNFVGVHDWISDKARSCIRPHERFFGVTCMSHKRRIVIPGAWPESPKSFSPVPAVEQTKSVSDNIIPARTPSPPPTWSPSAPKTPPLKDVKPAVAGLWSTPGVGSPWSPVTARPATTGLVSQSNHTRYSGQEGDLDLPMSRRVKGEAVWKKRAGGHYRANSAQKTSAALRRANPLAAVSQKQLHPAVLPGFPPPGLYTESDFSRPTSSGTDSSVSLRAPPGETSQASTPAAVDLGVGFRELELSTNVQTAKVAEEEERRRQEDEERAAEEKRAEEERKAKEEAEELARQAARAAEREAALSAMSEEERQVWERSRGLFKVLPQAHRETLQDLARKADAHTIRGNFKSKDLRTMTDGGSRAGQPRPWLNDEAVFKAMEGMCLRANEKAGVSKVEKGGLPAPFHGYSPMWFSTLTQWGDDTIRPWAKKVNHLGENLRKTQAVFLPICDGSHWRLLVISGQKRTIQYFDSLGGRGDHYIKIAKRLMRVFMGDHWDEAEWTVINEQKSPRQCNGSDCGMFTVLNIATILRGREVAQDSYDGAVATIDYARDWIAAAIIHGGFTDIFDWQEEPGLEMA